MAVIKPSFRDPSHMLLHQRIEFGPPTVGQNVYVRIPLSSTLWTVIEGRLSDGECVRSPSFPSRIVHPENEFSAVFTGVDMSSLLRAGPQAEYRVLWRTIPDPDDSSPKSLIALPLGREVVFTFSYGSSAFLSLSVGGIDVKLSFDITTRVLSTSWFTPPFTTSWTLEVPRRIMSRVIERIWSKTLTEDAQLLEGSPQQAEISDTFWSRMMAVCCRRSPE